MKKLFSFLMALLIIVGVAVNVYAAEEVEVDAKSAVLMDYTTGEVIYSKNMNEALPPASVTKIMTLLLVMEAVNSGVLSLDSELTVSDYAASMGGSQVFLEPGETMKTEELIKCVVISSANDAALTLAEAVAGSEEAFVEKMNKRAEELGMENTHFENVTGLDDDTQNHVTSAYDIALMSRELMKHTKIFEFTTVWMDTIRDGAFGLTNTNRLIRYYKGATGLKTGSTSKAGFCISATAERDGLHLIAVIMGSETRDRRNEAAKKLLDMGFAEYGTYTDGGGECGAVKITGSKSEEIPLSYEGVNLLVRKSDREQIKKEIEIPEFVKAPINKGDKIGRVKYLINDEVIAEKVIIAEADGEKIGFADMLLQLFSGFSLKT